MSTSFAKLRYVAGKEGFPSIKASKRCLGMRVFLETAAAVAATAVLLTVTSPVMAGDGHRGSMDVDGDGYISQTEFNSAKKQRGVEFSEIDGDADGLLSTDELVAFRKARKHKIRQLEGRGSMDDDGDGYVSQAEFDAAKKRRTVEFSDIDSDADGVLSKDELAAFRRARREKVRQPIS